MKWTARLIAAFTGLLLVLSISGTFMPMSYQVNRKIVLKAAPDAVWNLIANYETYPTWRRDLASIVKMPNREGRILWKEETWRGLNQVELLETKKPASLTLLVHDLALDTQETWNYELVSQRTGTEVRVSLRGEAANPLVRLFHRVVGRSAALESHLNELAAKLGEAARAEAL